MKRLLKGLKKILSSDSGIDELKIKYVKDKGANKRFYLPFLGFAFDKPDNVSWEKFLDFLDDKGQEITRTLIYGGIPQHTDDGKVVTIPVAPGLVLKYGDDTRTITSKVYFNNLKGGDNLPEYYDGLRKVYPNADGYIIIRFPVKSKLAKKIEKKMNGSPYIIPDSPEKKEYRFNVFEWLEFREDLQNTTLICNRIYNLGSEQIISWVKPYGKEDLLITDTNQLSFTMFELKDMLNLAKNYSDLYDKMFDLSFIDFCNHFSDNKHKMFDNKTLAKKISDRFQKAIKKYEKTN